MSNKIKYALGGKPINFEETRGRLERNLYDEAADRGGINLADHHHKWFATVWLNYWIERHNDLEVKWTKSFRYNAAGVGSQWHDTGEVEYLPDVTTPHTVYIMRWLTTTYPKKRDLSMISYQQAMDGASRMFAHHFSGNIVYTDSRLVTTFVPEGADPENPDNWYDIRLVQTENLVLFVGDALENCLRRSNRENYYSEDAGSLKRMYIVVKKGTTQIKGAFHRLFSYCDKVTGVYYAKMSSPLGFDNNSLGFLLPRVIDHDGWRLVTDQDAFDLVEEDTHRRRDYIAEKLRLRDFIERRSIMDAAEEKRQSLTEAERLTFDRRRMWSSRGVQVSTSLFGYQDEICRGFMETHLRWVNSLRDNRMRINLDPASREPMVVIDSIPMELNRQQMESRLRRVAEGVRPEPIIIEDIDQMIRTFGHPGGPFPIDGTTTGRMSSQTRPSLRFIPPPGGVRRGMLDGLLVQSSNRGGRSVFDVEGGDSPWRWVLSLPVQAEKEPVLEHTKPSKAQYQLEREDNFFHRQPPKEKKAASGLLGRMLGMNRTNVQGGSCVSFQL